MTSTLHISRINRRRYKIIFSPSLDSGSPSFSTAAFQYSVLITRVPLHCQSQGRLTGPILYCTKTHWPGHSCVWNSCLYSIWNLSAKSTRVLCPNISLQPIRAMEKDLFFVIENSRWTHQPSSMWVVDGVQDVGE